MDEPQTQIITLPALSLEQAGILADEAAADSLFADYQRRLAEETLRRHRADFALFTRYLSSAGVQIGDLMTDPVAWSGMSWGLLQGFVEWQLHEGYALGSINVRLSTIKAYAQRAAQADVLSMEVYVRMKLVKGFRRAEARHLDATRPVTRRGAKKAKPRFLSLKEVALLKRQPDTPQGRPLKGRFFGLVFGWWQAGAGLLLPARQAMTLGETVQAGEFAPAPALP